jgi:hypothetical protein
LSGIGSGYWWNPFKAVAKAWRSVWRGIKKYGRQIASIAVLFIPGLNIYAAGFLSGMCAHVLAWLLTPAASYAPDQLAP